MLCAPSQGSILCKFLQPYKLAEYHGRNPRESILFERKGFDKKKLGKQSEDHPFKKRAIPVKAGKAKHPLLYSPGRAVVCADYCRDTAGDINSNP